MDWLKIAIYSMVVFQAILAALFVRVIWVRMKEPHCRRCYYPIYNCECDEGDYGHDPHVERTVRRIKGDER